MLRTLFFIFLVLYNLPNAFAGNHIIFKFNSSNSTYAVKYAKVKVIDMRFKRTDVGYMRSGMFDRYSKSIPAYSLADMIADHYQQITISDDIKNRNEMLIVLHKFMIGETRPNTSDWHCHGWFSIDADIFIGNEGSYRLIGQTDSTFSYSITNYLRSTYTSIGPGIIKMVTAKTEEMLIKYGNIPYPEMGQQYDFTAAGEMRKKQKEIYPIYAAKQFKKGIYYTVDQFLQHTPGDTNFINAKPFSVKIRTDSPHYITRYNYVGQPGKAGEEVQDYFAIYDGNLWIASGNRAMKYEQGEFLIVRTFWVLRNNTPSITTINFQTEPPKQKRGAKSYSEDFTARFDLVTRTFVPVGL